MNLLYVFIDVLKMRDVFPRKTTAIPVSIAQTAMNSGAMALPNLIAPQAFEVRTIAEMKQEIFGPVLHIVRWNGDPQDVTTAAGGNAALLAG